jgi:phage-related protein
MAPEPREKPIVWLKGEIHTPPMSKEARIEAGVRLRCLQRGQKLAMPFSRQMPSIGYRCCELRVRDTGHRWRIVYRLDPDAIVILDVFGKKTRETPQRVVDACKDRLRRYDVE